ncbi:MAG: carboxypeptidase-like regulatory domain-containing protein, partial [Bacteroidales bacterium]|nr:carboxypeptidase-like regulatory domain-containing protein [Bacteroidales bacterium]
MYIKNVFKKVIFVLAAAFFCAFQLSAQINITGTVVDNTGSPVPGANVIVQGTATGVVTDGDGKYVITVADANTVLVFSFIGYASQEMVVGAQRNISVTMVEETQLIDEVVVVGYGVQKKVNMAGAVGTIKSDVLEAHAVTNV